MRETEEKLVKVRMQAGLVRQIDHWAIDKRNGTNITRAEAISYLVKLGLMAEAYDWPASMPKAKPFA